MKKQIMLIAFVAIAINAFSQNLIKGEYFVDSDPGFGNATGFSIAVPDSDLTQAIIIPNTSFNGSGYHNLFLRTMDSNGNWSQTSRSFVQADDNINLSEIINVEYFFNTDNGFGNNSFIMLDASPEKTWEITIPYDQLPSEWKTNDTLFVRVQDGDRKGWSQTTFIDSLNFVMVGIKNLEQITGVSIYPNPFSDEINVSLKNDDIIQLVLYNEKGQVIFNKKLGKSDIINTQFLASGIYLVAIYANNKRLYGSKIVKH